MDVIVFRYRVIDGKYSLTVEKRPLLTKLSSSICFAYLPFTFILTTMALSRKRRVDFDQVCDELAKSSTAAANGSNAGQLGFSFLLKYR